MKTKCALVILFALHFSGLFGQTKISGVVSDTEGNPLAYATVSEERTSNGVITDLNGKYSITLINDSSNLIFSYLGYKLQTIAFNGNPIINVTLVEDSQMLDDVVVVGYGVQKRSDVTGSVSTIKVADAKALPTTNVAEMLRGKSAGVQVTLNDPRPGGNSSILMRGANSFLGGNAPLIVLDGVPIENINTISPEDIESIEILKDASAQAIYGARASNGVILVTTRRGAKGKLKASYHGYYGEQWLTNNFDLYSGEEWIQLRREAYRTANNGEWEVDEVVFSPHQLDLLESEQFVDWEDAVMQRATQQSHSLTLQGGNEKISYFSGFGYIDQGGLIPSSGYKRGTARLNLDYKVNDRISFGSNIFLLTDEQDIETQGLNFIMLPPLATCYDDDGNLERYPLGPTETTHNPLWNIRESNQDLKSNEYRFNFFSDIKLFSNLTYRLNSSIRRSNSNGGRYRTSLHSSAFAVGGEARLSSSYTEEFLVENILVFNQEFNENHRLDFTAMQSVNERKYNWSRTTATGFPNDLLGYNGIESATEILPVDRVAWERRLLSFMGRFRYYLSDKYLLTLTGRADGSSVFATDNKWAFFPSAAFAWKVHLEPFMDKLDFINEFKLRLSYGSIGNEAIAPYQTKGLASARNYIFGDVSYGGYGPGSSLYNPDLKWETSTTFNGGIDFGFFRNFIVGTLEIYNTQTTDLLVDRTTPGSTGYTSMISNIGRVENKGIELSLTANAVSKKNFNWSVSTTFSRNRNKILELFGEVDEYGNLLDDIARKRFIGEPINVIHTYQFDGIWQYADTTIIPYSHMPDAEPGRIRVVDVNGDTTITTADKIIVHKDPKWYGSISSRLMFHGFELFWDIYIVQGATRTNSYLADYNSGGTLHGNLNGIKVDYWTPENPSNEYPRPNNAKADPYLWAGAVRDASYVRLRTLSLAYHFPERWVSKAKLSNLTLYGTFTNMFTWTKFKSYSPETTVGQYPDGKSFIFGIKISTF